MTKYLYSKIADQLEKRIKEGEYGIHQKLPSEQDLSAQFNTTRLTIRKSIDELIRREVVVKDRNRGTFVLSPHTKISSGINGLVGFTEAAKSRNLDSRTIVLDFHSIKRAPKKVIEKLNLNYEEPFWRIERLRLINKTPMTHELIFLRKKFVPKMKIDDAKESLFEIIEKSVPIAYADQDLEAVSIEKEMAQMLKIKENAPAFLAHTVSYSADGYPILFDESYYRADKYTFHNVLYRKH
ncbi:GntR family transcriptional regulator, LSA1692 subfamily [Companilactobacillus alimentarius]|uniref:GntR family transcriptional regulator n=1 Tax=Companilactobacillus alimentarius DSM 20249 TaxID=1423720 RepID=A0A2K9HP51_9LACO|nr:GntR family transcriptional regulator, LSA1692 subfamily [Companilactobacillus alimentarius]AUI71052.1 GntR family transcriptional regulator [Companilactobacillus alimentarius DSM 20249]KRK75168.1 transcriptional regulator, GntR family [Companilactobacillus alimentarius DSM 20249]MDT6951695.1 GntR family transcriptional regulator, LSA1692 subfamily [Companilactobacillus alimentarius]GEO44056.1 GntR family transcriptional regulator [Companilactobacillus alimentarius]